MAAIADIEPVTGCTGDCAANWEQCGGADIAPEAKPCCNADMGVRCIVKDRWCALLVPSLCCDMLSQSALHCVTIVRLHNVTFQLTSCASKWQGALHG